MELKNIIRENIKNLKAYSSARDEFKGEAKVFLDANELPYGDFNRYPDPYQSEIKETISKIRKTKSNQVFVGNGSDEAIDLLFRIFCNPGIDKAITLSPSYGMYNVSASINDVELIQVETDYSKEVKFDVIEPYLLNPRVKLLFLCSPNNPTGTSFSVDFIKDVLEKFNGIVVVDEAYIDFSDEVSLVGLIEEFNNLVVLQTMSKAWGAAGLRIGFAFSNKEIIDLFNKVKPPYNVSAPAQKEALKILNDLTKYQSQLEESKKEKIKLKEVLGAVDFVGEIYPSDANFFLIQLNMDVNADSVYEYLINKGVVVRNRSKEISNSLRITVGTREENELLINELKKYSNEKSTVYR